LPTIFADFKKAGKIQEINPNGQITLFKDESNQENSDLSHLELESDWPPTKYNNIMR